MVQYEDHGLKGMGDFIIIRYLQALLTNPAAPRECQNRYASSAGPTLFSALAALANEISLLHSTKLLQERDKFVSDILIWD